MSILLFIKLKTRNGRRKCTLLRGQPKKAQNHNKLRLLVLLQNVTKFFNFLLETGNKLY